MRPIFNKKITEMCNLWVCEQYTGALFTVEKINKCGLKKKKSENADFNKTWTWDVKSKQVLSVCLDTNEKLKLFYYSAYFYYYL